MNLILNKIIKVGLYSTLLLPILFTPFTYFPWNFGKTVIFQIVVEILCFLYIIGRMMGDEKKVGNKLNWLDWALVIFLVAILASAFAGVNIGNSFWGNQARSNGIFTWLHFGAWYFLLTRFFREKREWTNLFSMSIGVAILAGVTVVFPHILPTTWQSEAGGGIIGNRAFAASYLLIAAGLSLFLSVILKNKARYIYLIAAVLIFIAIFCTGNRGALLGVAVGIFAGLATSIFLFKNKTIRIWLVAVLGLFLIFNGTLATLMYTGSIATYFPWLPRIINVSSFTSGTGETRLMAWNIAQKGMKERPLTGWGWGNYDVVFNKYFNPHFLKFNFTETVWDKPHNWVLEIANNSGIFGLVSFLSIYGFSIFYLIRNNKHDAQTSVLIGILVGYLVSSLFLFETVNTMLLWFLLLAYISVEYATKKDISVESTGKHIYKRLSIVGLILFPISLFSFNFVPLKTSYFLSKAHSSTSGFDWAINAKKTLDLPRFVGENGIFLAERFVQLDKTGVDMKAKQTVLEAVEVASALERQSVQYSENPLFPVWAGQIYMILGETVDQKYYVDAERLLLRAKEISPQKQEFLFFLGRLYLLKKDFPRAIEMQKIAIAADPSISISHWFFGLTNIASGDSVAGLKEIESAISLGFPLTLNQRLYILDIYAEEKNYVKVIEGYEYLVKVEPENVNWYIRLATAYAVDGQKVQALETVNKAIKLYPPLQPDADKFIKQYKLK